MKDEDKFDYLTSLRRQYADCQRCELCNERTEVVFGSGNPNAKILVIGGSPGVEEDKEGVPFSGPTGNYFASIMSKAWPTEDPEFESINAIKNEQKFLDKAMEYLEEYCFFSNAVMCIPPRGQPPKKSHTNACGDRLARLIYTVDPDVIIACGAVAATAIVGKQIKIKRFLGQLLDVPIVSPITREPIRYGMYVIYTPAYLLSKGDAQLVSRKRGDTYQTINHCKNILQSLDTMYQIQTGHHFWEA